MQSYRFFTTFANVLTSNRYFHIGLYGTESKQRFKEILLHSRSSKRIWCGYWETGFPQIKPHKAGRNVRQYTKEDIETIRVIYNLLKVRGLKIAKARELLKSNKEGAQSNTEVLIQLREIREKLIHLRKAINHIDVDSLPDEQQ